MTYRSNEITIAGDSDSATGDAFGRLRVSQPESLFSFSQIQGSGGYYFTESTSGGGALAYDEDLSATVLSVGTAPGDMALRQSKKYIKYEAGRSQLTIMTASMAAQKTNLEQCCGYYDDDDGVFFLNDGTTNYFVLRSSTSGVLLERAVPQSEWSIDTADGSGTSEFNLDISKANIYAFDLQWLGVGRVRCGLETPTGELIYVHSFDNANSFNSVYMKKANLPVRWEIKNNGVTASSSEMQQICAGVFSEGGFRPLGNPGSTNTGVSSVTIGNTEEALLAVRLKSQFNRATIVPIAVDVSVGSNASLLVRIYVCQGTVTGTYLDASEKSEAQINPNNIPSEKILIDSFYVNSSSRVASNELKTDLDVNAKYDGTVETLLVTAQTLGGNASTNCAVKWREI